MASNVHVTLDPKYDGLIASFSSKIPPYTMELKELFPERDWLIQQLMICLITGKNQMIFGLPGTAKSKFIRTVFDSIKGTGIDGKPCERFAIQMDVDTTKSDLIGPYNMKLMDQGIWERVVAGYMPTAHIVYLDEAFDSLSMLRGLNDMLNEGELIEGLQHLHVPLITAVGATNKSPESITALYPGFDLPAFVDRWLCTCKVGYLEKPESRSQMMADFLMGNAMTNYLDFAELQAISMLVRTTNQFPTDDYVALYVAIMDAYNEKLLKRNLSRLSDRRYAWLSQVAEASAIMNGRRAVSSDDMLTIVYALADCPEAPERKLFLDTAEPIIASAQKQLQDDTDAALKIQLARISADVQTLEAMVKPAKWPTSTADVGPMLENIKKLREELQTLTPKLTTTKANQNKLIKRVDELKATVTSKF